MFFRLFLCTTLSNIVELYIVIYSLFFHKFCNDTEQTSLYNIYEKNYSVKGVPR